MLDAYDRARLNGFSGTRLDFQKSEYARAGLTAALNAGYQGSEESLQKSLAGTSDKSAWSAYEIAKAYGFNGSAQDWLDSLHGADGQTAYELAVSKGFQGNEQEWLDTLQGKDGLDAYQVWLSLGNVGEKDVYLDSLRGLPGQDGQDGEDGKDGLSAYQIAVQNGFVGSESEWLRSLQGQDGEDGAVGPMPRHEWSGSRLRFEKPDGTWGEWVDLRGTGAVASGGGGGSLSIQKFYASADDFPTPGKTQILYFDQSTDPYGVYVWTGTAYQQVGGGASAPSETSYGVNIRVKNQTGATILKGTPLMAAGTLGASSIIKAAPMDGTDPENAKFLLGLAAADIPDGGDGEAVDIGKVRGLDTSAWSEGDVLWISNDTVGALTNVKPVNGLLMPVAFVVTSRSNNGAVMVRVTPTNEAAFVQQSFETISKNLKASDYELTYNGAGDLTVITYANGIIKTLGYLGSGDLGTIALSGATPGGIDLVKTLLYTDGNLTSVSYS
jgi:hypothetical protein